MQVIHYLGKNLTLHASDGQPSQARHTHSEMHSVSFITSIKETKSPNSLHFGGPLFLCAAGSVARAGWDLLTGSFGLVPCARY